MQLKEIQELFPSWWTMISVDLLLIVLAGIGTAVVIINWKMLQKARATLGVSLILAGLWVHVFLYIADIYIMMHLPRLVGMTDAMASMGTLHLGYSWYINTASAALILAGLVLTVMQFMRQINVVEANSRALEESEYLLESVFQNVPVGLLIKDADNIVERPNNTYLNWYGLTSAEMVGQRSHEIEDFQSSQDIEIMKNQELQVLRTGAIHTRQAERQFADGQRHIVSITKFPVYDRHGDITKVGSVSVDLTELVDAKQRAEEARTDAESANREKSTFLANMSHELRTPLNAIIGFSETMLAQMFGPLGSGKYREQASAIHQSGHHLLDLVNDILDMAKIESEAYEISPERFDLREIVADCFQIVHGLAGQNRIELVKQLPNGVSMVTADKRATRQILLNLVSNAVKFTPEGGSVSVSATVANEDLTLCVKDNGAGMHPDEIPNLTKPFAQGARNHAYITAEGTGLGLSIVASLVRMHHGTLQIDSEIGEGTCVTVFLPGMMGNDQAYPGGRAPKVQA